ncbi:MAG: YceD family protein [Pseudomonadota bacterium]
MSAFVIDAFEFCRSNGHREGVTPVAEMSRLNKDSADHSGEIAWAVDGTTSIQGYPQITVSVSGAVQLMCQRCLTPYAYEIDAGTVLMLGKDDDQADEIEELLGDETIDVIVGSRACDIRELIEDEALLALPQVPKHDVCPDSKLLDVLKSEKPSPFAGLKDLTAE